jgi:hypothetical protein
MRKLLFLLVVAGFTFPLLSSDTRSRIAVMEFTDETGSVDDKVLLAASQYMRSLFVGSNKYIVISRERQQNEMVKVMRKESHQICRAKDCQIPLGQSLSADTILVSTISRFGGSYTLTVELIDLAKEATIRGAKSEFDGKEDGLKSAIDDVVSQVFGVRKGTFKEGRIGGEVDSWTPEGGDETIVHFESDPAGAAVLVNGRMLCQTPCSRMVSQGRNEISMQIENYVPQTKTETVRQGTKIRYDLEPDFGYLTVKGNYSVAVKLDGQNIGNTPIEKRIISPGPHQVEHTDQCFHPSGEKFTIKRGKNRTINLDLKAKESAIRVVATCKDTGDALEAEVFVDGRSVGKAPGTFKVPLCSKEVVVKGKNGEYKERLRLRERRVSDVMAKVPKKDPSFPHSHAGLDWSNPSPNRMNHSNAIKYCRDRGGRLPTISELRTLIKNCPSTQTGGACKVTDSCLLSSCWSRGTCFPNCSGNNSVFGDTGWFWSSSVLSDGAGTPWGVGFSSGGVGNDDRGDYDGSVRCVK